MRHDWENIPIPMHRFGVNAIRRCRNCAIEQTKEDVQDWGRVVGYRWRPLAGRCKGKRKAKKEETMKTKAFYIRDEGTTIPAIAVQLLPENEAQREVISRAGYGRSPDDQRSYVMVFRADGSSLASTDPFETDPHRSTLFFAHIWLRAHFDSLEDGMHLDVQPFREASGRGDYIWQANPVPPLKKPE